MNENEFRERWLAEKAMYDAWGKLIVKKISESLSTSLEVDLQNFLKIPAMHRLKDDNSLIDKAFYRNKQYKNPYDDIEDKVGVRFVVMLQSDADKVCQTIAEVSETLGWDLLHCRNYQEERIAEPMLFTYQSHHFIVRNRQNINESEIFIKENTPCEIQVRSLLQHAYAELTHDAVYKKKTLIEPEVTRTIAKTMAFIETADEFFLKVVGETEPATVSHCESLLDSLFEDLTGVKPIKLNSTIIILDTFKYLIDDTFEDDIKIFVQKNEFIGGLIKEKMTENKFYMQGVIVFIYWLMKRRKSALEDKWPLDWKVIESMRLDMGLSFNRVC
ncbi:GTP pyrophosphokinase [Pantoea agglomerans]|uniref:GTP pyrophosphokinase n=1 Tax=Enterobacter agglomerans TaxID=549 RepID=UPI0016548F40|nr:RelA/SpoT domain-containing protein [Pantoea agglomerans]